ncbi:MAG: flippase [Actinomycetota bacterium]|nr:flippase [Actinomycetota bacterium]
MSPSVPNLLDGRRSPTSRASDGVLATAKGTGYLAGGSFFEFAARFVIALLLARLMGPAEYGLYVLAISAAALLAGISQLGLDDAMVRYVAILSGRGDREGVWGTIQIGLGISVAVGCVMGGVLFAAATPIAESLFDAPALAPALRFIGIIVPLLTISNVLAGVARGFGRMDHAALAENIVMSLVRLGLLGAAAALGRLDLLVATIIFAVSDIAASLTLIVLLKRNVPVKALFRSDVRRDLRPILRFALPLWMSSLLRQFRRNIETFLLGALAAASTVGVFAVVGRVNLVGHVFLLSILLAVKPVLARLHDRHDREGLQEIYRTATRWALTLCVPFFLVMVLYPRPILTMFGEAFGSGATALVILAFAELANAATGICGPMIDMTGHTKVKLANAVLWTALAVTGNALLVPRWGLVGAAVAMLIAIVSVNVLCVIEVWVLERLAPFDRNFLKPAAAAVIALACGWLVNEAVPLGTDLVQAAMRGIMVSAIYLGLLLLFGLPVEDRLVVERTLEKARTFMRSRRTVAGAAVEKT